MKNCYDLVSDPRPPLACGLAPARSEGLPMAGVLSARQSNLLGGKGQQQSRNNSCPIDLFNSSNYSQEPTLQTHAGKLKIDQNQMCYRLSNSKSIVCTLEHR